MSAVKEPSEFTVVELKEKLKILGLSLVGNKPELIARLMEEDPSGAWMKDTPETSGAGSSNMSAAPATVDHQRETEIHRREKELAERELALARAEMQLLRGIQGINVSDQAHRVERGSTTVSSKLSVAAVADLLGYFDGNTGDYANWEQQLTLLKNAYGLTESYTKILIGMRLRGKALK